MEKEKYNKADVIYEVENWIVDLKNSYTSSEVSVNCLVYEWKNLRKKLEK